MCNKIKQAIPEHLGLPTGFFFSGGMGGSLCFHMFVCVVLYFCLLCLFVRVLYLVYPMLPASLDCPFLMAPSVVCNVYKPGNLMYVLDTAQIEGRMKKLDHS